MRWWMVGAQPPLTLVTWWCGMVAPLGGPLFHVLKLSHCHGGWWLVIFSSQIVTISCMQVVLVLFYRPCAGMVTRTKRVRIQDENMAW